MTAFEDERQERLGVPLVVDQDVQMIEGVLRLLSRRGAHDTAEDLAEPRVVRKFVPAVEQPEQAEGLEARLDSIFR